MQPSVLTVMHSFTTMLVHAPIVATKEMRIMKNEWNWMRVKKSSKKAKLSLIWKFLITCEAINLLNFLNGITSQTVASST